MKNQIKSKKQKKYTQNKTKFKSNIGWTKKPLKIYIPKQKTKCKNKSEKCKSTKKGSPKNHNPTTNKFRKKFENKIKSEKAQKSENRIKSEKTKADFNIESQKKQSQNHKITSETQTKSKNNHRKRYQK